MTGAASKSLADIAESVRYGYTASATNQPIGPHFLRITDIVPPQIDWGTVPYCEIDDAKKRRFALTCGDIVVARTGATVGYSKLIRQCDLDAVFASYLVRIRIDPQKANPEYVGRIVESHVYKRFVMSRISGAAQPNANAKVLSEFRLPIPTESIQRRIAAILSTYDDLIENNRRRIQLLERSASLLFKEWFVRLRFPGHEWTTITDGVPEGWERRTLNSVATIIMGQSPKSRYYNEDRDGLPFHQGVKSFGCRFPIHRVYSTAGNRIANGGDILFSVRAPVGRINIAPDRLVLGRGIAGLRSRMGHQAFLYYALKSHFIRDDMMGSGTVFAAIAKRDLHQVLLLHPPQRLVQTFVALATPIDKQVQVLHRNIQNLSQARDLLLPRLMNGEISV